MLLEKAKAWARNLKRDIVALWIAARDPRTPFSAKLVAGAVAAYALSPIDLIPDFIPVLGYLDDLLIAPLGILIAIRLIPEPLMADFRRQALERDGKPKSMAAASAIIVIWLVSITALAYWLMR
ncbi:YkvA family protein [Brucella sp. NBRC 113783]|uniref:YkvA family protein n=1 Tax=Brucella sp. NBRC 113783 TaxID=3075478 RepID=UPI0029C02C85|nr:YkvA family protein [Brucella sp. NBRC 113783]MDX4074117.1 YkvA family protein [Brucella sp. NBRC 113783]